MCTNYKISINFIEDKSAQRNKRKKAKKGEKHVERFIKPLKSTNTPKHESKI